MSVYNVQALASLSPSPHSFLIYCLFGGFSLLWISPLHLGYLFSTHLLAWTYQGKYEFSYLHEAHGLTAG